MRSLALMLALGVAGLAWAKPAAMPMPEAEDDGEHITMDVNPTDKGVTVKRSMPVPNAAKKLFTRYQKVSDGLCPVTLKRGGDGKKLAWIVGKDPKGTCLVFLTVNLTEEPREIVFRLTEKEPMIPTYRRLFSKDKGKKWESIAFEPPHHSISGCAPIMRKPYTIEVPAYSCQSAIVRLK